MSSGSTNFHYVRKIEDLPQVPASVVTIFVDNDADAMCYATKNPSRPVYWIAERQIAIWFTPLRRINDLSVKMLV